MDTGPGGENEAGDQEKRWHTKSCSGTVQGAWICCPMDVAECWAHREHTCVACCFPSPQSVWTPPCHSAPQLQVGQGDTAAALGGGQRVCVWGCGLQHPALSAECCLSGLFWIIPCGPGQALGTPPGLGVCALALFLSPGQFPWAWLLGAS